MKAPDMTLDTAVVGGGITGLYACHLLRRRKAPDYRIALFEAGSRFGGRIETVEMDGFLAEYGPMRFERRAQPLLLSLIEELGLGTAFFPPYASATDPESLFDLHQNEGRSQAASSQAEMLNALELFSLGILRVLGQSGGDRNDPRDPRHWDWWAGLDEDFYRLVQNELSFKGRPLYDQGLWNVLSDVLSHKAVKKIIEYGTFYHFIHHNPNAAEWINFWLKGLHPKEELYSIKQGTESLVTRLVEELAASKDRPAVPLHRHHRLETMQQEPDGRVLLELRTENGESVTVKARHLVLATAQSPLKKLAPCLPQRIRDLVHSVIPVPLLKCFFISESPWWDESTRPQTGASTLPTRELHYSLRREGEERKGMVMVYGDRPSLSYWKPFVKGPDHLVAELNGNELLLDRYVQHLIPEAGSEDSAHRERQRQAVTCFGIHDWDREPFEAGCHIWKPGQCSTEAMSELQSFALSGSPQDPPNVHICGEAYSDFQGFIEGGLRTAKAVVERIDM